MNDKAVSTDSRKDKLLIQGEYALEDTVKLLETTDDEHGLREHLAKCQRIQMVEACWDMGFQRSMTLLFDVHDEEGRKSASFVRDNLSSLKVLIESQTIWKDWCLNVNYIYDGPAGPEDVLVREPFHGTLEEECEPFDGRLEEE